MPISEEDLREEFDLKVAVMCADLKLKERQWLWETPKGIAAMAAAMAVVIGAIAGVLGYQIARTPPAQVAQFPPGTVITASAAPAAK